LGDHNGHKYCLCCCPCISCIYCIYCLFCCFCCFCCFSSVLHSTSCSWCPGCCIFPWPFERLGFSQVFPGICSTPGKIFCTSHSLLQGCHNGIQQAQLCQLFQPVPPHSVLRLYFFFWCGKFLSTSWAWQDSFWTFLLSHSQIWHGNEVAVLFMPGALNGSEQLLGDSMAACTEAILFQLCLSSSVPTGISILFQPVLKWAHTLLCNCFASVVSKAHDWNQSLMTPLIPPQNYFTPTGIESHLTPLTQSTEKLSQYLNGLITPQLTTNTPTYTWLTTNTWTEIWPNNQSIQSTHDMLSSLLLQIWKQTNPYLKTPTPNYRLIPDSHFSQSYLLTISSFFYSLSSLLSNLGICQQDGLKNGVLLFGASELSLIASTSSWKWILHLM